MARVKRGVTARARHKKLLKQTKGFRSGRSRLVRQAREALFKAESYRYRDRRNKKRAARRLWIVKINAFARMQGLSYSALIAQLKKHKIELDRKVLAELIEKNPDEVEKILDKVKTKLSQAGTGTEKIVKNQKSNP